MARNSCIHGHGIAPGDFASASSVILASGPHHATGTHRDEHERANWYRPRSSAPFLINRFTDSFPRCILHPGLKSLALERRLAEPKHTATLSFRDDAPETLLDICPHRRPFFCREFLRLLKK